ncbi:MAG: hypothetical protein JSR71_14550 [Proteobacteria bacterium]|nr:hypothetical protein [Pseudomonadota bacterium]
MIRANVWPSTCMNSGWRWRGIDTDIALSMMLESLYASMGFNRVITFFRDAGMLKAKVGFCSGVPDVLPGLTFPEAYAADVFHLPLANKADVFIQDAAAAGFQWQDWFDLRRLMHGNSQSD